MLQSGDAIGRDVFNEKIGKEAEAGSGIKGSGGAILKRLADKAVIYTTMGEIHLDLYP